ncbi:MAG: hypothetical protein HYY60_01290 [Parcubacteria group bacterium]|nr:hypothetical protein [Parcubacteria group bacterium]
METPFGQTGQNPSPFGDEKFNKPTLWLIIGVVALFIVIAVWAFFKFGGQGKSDDEIKAEILRSLSAPSNAPEISAEEKQQILNSLSAPSNAPQISDEENLQSLSAPSQ